MALNIVHERLLKSLQSHGKPKCELYERVRPRPRLRPTEGRGRNAGFNIKKWVRENLPRSYEWLQSHVRLYAEWDKFLTCLKWADDAQYPRT